MGNDTLGRHGRDVITGFEGIIMGRCEYLTGCTQILLTARFDKYRGGSDQNPPVGQWFDDSRIEVAAGEPVQLPNHQRVTEAPGPDAPAPVK